MAHIGEPVTLLIRRSPMSILVRLGLAVGAVLCWLGLWVLDQIVSLIFWSEPTDDLLLISSPMLLVVPWLVYTAFARATLRVHHDALEIRQPRLLRRRLTVPRDQVDRIHLDDGTATGRARFATGDPHDPLLWTDPWPRLRRPERVLLGDTVHPNLAIELRTPMALGLFRDPVRLIAADRAPVPVRLSVSTPARVLMLAVEDLDAARLALSGWPVHRPDLSAVVPPQVAAANARIPREASVFLLLAALGTALVMFELVPLLPVWLAVAFWFARSRVQRLRDDAAAARADVDRRLATLSADDRTTALAVIDANLESRPSQGPPGWR